MQDKNDTFLNWIGYQLPKDFTKARWLGGLLGIILVLFVTILVVGIVTQLLRAVFLADTIPNIRDVGLAFAAIIGFPFIVWRSLVAHRQVETSRDELFNTKLNEAIDSLHAQRQITIRDPKHMLAPRTTIGDEANETLIDVWEDDIIKRNGAIDRLESLAVGRPSEAPRIARTLCVYLRELTREYPAEAAPENATPEEIRDWADELKVKRSDMETAAQVLGRMYEKTGVTPEDLAIDLSDVNLQAMRLNSLNFEHAQMNNAFLDGAKLNRAELNGARLDGAKLNGAELYEAKVIGVRFNDAFLNCAILCGTDLSEMIFNHTELTGADLCGTTLYWANFNGTPLRHAMICYANIDCLTEFNISDATGLALKSVDLSKVPNIAEFINSAFGDASVILPKGVARPKSWPDQDLDDETYQEEWTLFKEAPDAYIPPQNRS